MGVPQAALVRLAGLGTMMSGLLLPAFGVCGWACGRYPLLSLDGQTAAWFIGLGPAAAYGAEAALVLLVLGLLGTAVVSLVRTVPADLPVAELAAAVLSLAVVLSLDVVAAARLSAPVGIDAPSGSPLLPQVLVAPVGCLVVLLGAAVGVGGARKGALAPSTEP